MAINHRNVDAVVLESLYTIIGHLLEPPRAERWAAMLRSEQRLQKLSPFEFFEKGRRLQAVKWCQTESWLNFENFLKAVSSYQLLGLQWQGRHDVLAFDGTCRDLLDLVSKVRVDCWSIVLGKNMSVVTTHEGNYGVMTW